MVRHIEIWIHHNRFTLSPVEENISVIVEQGFELNIYFFVNVLLQNKGLVN